MPLKNKNTDKVPWDYQIGDDNYQLDSWILKKGKEYVTIKKDNSNKGCFHLQKDKEKRLSLNALQIRLTYRQLINFGYKLQKQKKQLSH